MGAIAEVETFARLMFPKLPFERHRRAQLPTSDCKGGALYQRCFEQKDCLKGQATEQLSMADALSADEIARDFPLGLHLHHREHWDPRVIRVAFAAIVCPRTWQ